MMQGIEAPAVPDRDAETAPAETRGLNTWIELSRSAHAGNLAFLRRCVGPRVELSAVVKSNAYGHGALEIARSAIDAGADSFCVHSLDEAAALRAAGFREDVLVMGHVPFARLAEAVALDLRLVAYHPETVEILDREARARETRARVHAKIETGTHRQGVEGAELDALLSALRRAQSVELEGVYTHFANIEDTTDHEYARYQLGRFHEALETVHREGFGPPRRHAACSAATVLFPETHFDMVRAGISQYGFWSSKETRLSHGHAGMESGGEELRPVLTWKTRVSQVKEVEAGSAVGYGCSFVTTRPSRIAVLPVGYSDGYDRRLSNAAHVLVDGRRAPVRGRVCMNLIMVDVTDVPDVKPEQEVVLLGRQGSEEVTAEQLAGWIGTIHYEVVTRLAPHIPRHVVG